MDDLISRQAAIDVLDTGLWGVEWDKALATAMLKDLPSEEPERKNGHWIKVNGKTAINCSACYHCSWSLLFRDTVKRFNFCPNCGARME